MADFIELTDYEDPRLDFYARLNETQLKHYYEPNGGLFITESPKVTERALGAGMRPVSALVERKQIEGEAAEILEKLGDIPVFTGGPEALRNLTNIPMTRGLLCLFERPVLPTVEEVVSDCRRIAVLENVTNPTNVGAIMRSAAALGMEAVILTSSCSDPYYRRASRVAMGTVFQVPWTFAENTEKGRGMHYVRFLQSLGFKTAALALRKDTVTIDDSRLRAEEKLAVILGAEGDGLADETIDACDYTIKIPMAHGVDSLNVAACSAVAFWELARRIHMDDDKEV
ncbi:MAG: RNA methyltransferase [Lachnospiraceae bacterium]|nr:RNA methyltransferase [Lachnospiraceae bacterium]